MVAQEAMQVVWGRAEGQAVLEDERELADGVDPAALGDPVAGRHHLPVERGVDRLAPAVALTRGNTDKQRPQATGGVVAGTLPRIESDEVERVALAQHVGAVARNPARRGLHGHPLAAQRELHDAGPIELRRQAWDGHGVSMRRDVARSRDRYSAASRPPSTKITWPFTNDDASDARNTAAPTSSDGSPQRPAGVRPGASRRRPHPR